MLVRILSRTMTALTRWLETLAEARLFVGIRAQSSLHITAIITAIRLDEIAAAIVTLILRAWLFALRARCNQACPSTRFPLCSRKDWPGRRGRVCVLVRFGGQGMLGDDVTCGGRHMPMHCGAHASRMCLEVTK